MTSYFERYRSLGRSFLSRTSRDRIVPLGIFVDCLFFRPIMFRLRCLLNALFFGIFLFLGPAVALAQDEKEPPEWVVSYFLLLLFLGLAILILLRPNKRTESALTQDEVDAERAKTAGKKAGH